MKYSCALFCAALISLPIASASANDITRADDNVRYQLAAIDQDALLEAKDILEKISQELNKPVHEIEPAAGLYDLVPEDYNAAQQPPQPIAQNKDILDEPPVLNIEELTISREGDVDMSCGALSQEALQMRNMIYTMQNEKDAARMQSNGVTAAGAIGSFLIGSVTGGVGLAVGGFLLEQNLGSVAEDADDIQDIAAQRRTLMMGIFNAKGCEGPLEHAMQNPDIFNPFARLAAAEDANTFYGTPDYNQ